MRFELRILHVRTETHETVNYGSKRYPDIRDEVTTTEEDILQFRNSPDEEWQDVPTEYEYRERRE